MKTWDEGKRRLTSLVVVATAAFLVLVGLGLFLLAQGSWLDGALWILAAVILILIIFEVLVIVLAESSPHPNAARAASAGGGAHASAAPTSSYEAPKALTLRCGDCATVFDVQDYGQRPLYHSCPGCGAEGVLKDESGHAHVQPVASGGAQAAVGAAPAAAVSSRKRLKLRCGGCEHIFVLEDPGTRPLRHACPNCGRKGELK